MQLHCTFMQLHCTFRKFQGNAKKEPLNFSYRDERWCDIAGPPYRKNTLQNPVYSHGFMIKFKIVEIAGVVKLLCVNELASEIVCSLHNKRIVHALCKLTFRAW